MKTRSMRWTHVVRAALAASAITMLLAACAQGGPNTDSSAVPSGSIKAYGVIDEGISVTR